MDLRHAMVQISQINEQLARTEVFRGYRSLSVSCTGLIAIAAALFQPRWVPDPVANLAGYLTLWITVAALSVAITGTEMFLRARAARSGLARQMTLLAIEQFLPPIVAGALLTTVIARRWPEAAWMLPGLWSLLFSLSVFSSYRLLPRATWWVGVHYLLCGVVWLWWGNTEGALNPWFMGISFGGGQLMSATVLYWSLEREHGADEASR